MGTGKANFFPILHVISVRSRSEAEGGTMNEETYAAAAEAAMPGMFRMAYSILENRHDAEDAVQQAQ